MAPTRRNGVPFIRTGSDSGERRAGKRAHSAPGRDATHAGQISDGVSAMSKLDRAAVSSSTRKTATFFLTRPMSSGSRSSQGPQTGRLGLFGSFPFGSISVRSELRESD